MTISEWIRSASDRLVAIRSDSATLEARLILGHVLGQERSWIIAHGNDPCPSIPVAENLLTKRLNHVPLAYILGNREFYGRSFTVSEATLIPRADTETLVEAALEVLPKNATILDMGTGTGCIAITLKLERPDLIVYASDVSDAALHVAKQNAKNLVAEVEFHLSDGFMQIQNLQFDHLVSNPPYVEVDAKIAPEVRDHEPKQALFAGADGLDFYRRLAKEAPAHTSGWILLEVGDNQSDAVTHLFQEKNPKIWHDLAGFKRVVGINLRNLG